MQNQWDSHRDRNICEFKYGFVMVRDSICQKRGRYMMDLLLVESYSTICWLLNKGFLVIIKNKHNLKGLLFSLPTWLWLSVRLLLWREYESRHGFCFPRRVGFIAKLQAYVVHGTSLKLLKNYLSNRSQRTKVNVAYSSWVELLACLRAPSI